MINKGDNVFFHNFHIWWKSGKHTMWKNGGKLLTFTHQRRRRPEMNVSKRYFSTQKRKTGVSDSCSKRDGSRWANRTDSVWFHQILLTFIWRLCIICEQCSKCVKIEGIGGV